MSRPPICFGGRLLLQYTGLDSFTKPFSQYQRCLSAAFSHFVIRRWIAVMRDFDLHAAIDAVYLLGFIAVAVAIIV